MIVSTSRDQNHNTSISFTSAANESFTSTSSLNIAKNVEINNSNYSLNDNNKIESKSYQNMPTLNIESITSPTRCRSLDALTAGDSEISQPGELTKEESIQKDTLGFIHSSPVSVSIYYISVA